MNRINNQINSMAYFEPFFMGVSDNLQDEIASEKTDMSFADEASEKLPVKDAITLSHITYAYPNTEKYIFKDAFMKIPIGAAVGIVGTSGAGKLRWWIFYWDFCSPPKGMYMRTKRIFRTNTGHGLKISVIFLR